MPKEKLSEGVPLADSSIIRELSGTEKTYLNGLKKLCKEFDSWWWIRSQGTALHMMAQIIPELIDISNKVERNLELSLDSDLNERAKIVLAGERIRLMEEFANSAKSYSLAMERLTSDEQSLRFKDGTLLSSVYITPVQRIGRYELFIKEILRAHESQLSEQAQMACVHILQIFSETFTRAGAIGAAARDFTAVLENISMLEDYVAKTPEHALAGAVSAIELAEEQYRINLNVVEKFCRQQQGMHAWVASFFNVESPVACIARIIPQLREMSQVLLANAHNSTGGGAQDLSALALQRVQAIARFAVLMGDYMNAYENLNPSNLDPTVQQALLAPIRQVSQYITMIRAMQAHNTSLSTDAQFSCGMMLASLASIAPRAADIIASLADIAPAKAQDFPPP